MNPSRARRAADLVIPLQEPNPLPSARSVPKACTAMSYRDANHLKSTFHRELWSEAGTWLLERTQTLWNDGMPDEASALYSEFSRGPALGE